jgi:Flp pilus assembly pilin Flp
VTRKGERRERTTPGRQSKRFHHQPRRRDAASTGDVRMKKVFGYLNDEQGIETLEWIAVGALIVAVALVIYPGTLQGGLQSVINTVVGKINT